jgi:hypothetical protein
MASRGRGLGTMDMTIGLLTLLGVFSRWDIVGATRSRS